MRHLLLALVIAFCVSPLSAQTGTTPQTITLQTITNQTLGIASFEVLAVTPTNLPLTYTVMGPAILYRRMLTLTGTGTVSGA